MNITAARKQLHQISKSNPENQNFHFFQFDSNNTEPSLKNKFQQQDFSKKNHHQSKQAYERFLKQQCSKIIAQKSTNQQKIEVKIPLFKNNKMNDFASSQKQRYQKLGLQEFLNEQLPQQSFLKKSQEPEEQKIIKNLNNTYFRTTQNINPKRKDMINTLGIKKSSMSNYKVEWNEKNYEELEIQWKQIKYIPNKVFPCRKNSNVKSKIFAPKSNEPAKEITKAKNKEEKIFVDLNKIKRASSANILQNKQLAAKTSRITQNSFSLTKKMPQRFRTNNFYQQNSKTLNLSQQLFNKKKFTNVLKDSSSPRPKSQNRRRPLTSRQSSRIPIMSKNQSFYEGKRKYSEPKSISFNSFESFMGKERGSSKQINFIKDQELNSGVIVGRRISIRH